MPTSSPFNYSEETKSDFSGKHILIADDEPINMMVISKMLIARKATISKAVNGNEVLQMLENGLKPDLILLDIKMPELDGFMTIEQIRQQYPTLIVLAFTASFLDEESEQLLIKKGFYGSLSKSFKPDIFYTRISEALEAFF
ncbi:response regulator [Panacibacter ginsenosidivorans]|uniref:Response regulator n=1 Tax=Panacibacter ginsenosidivorans TaxID=1813871 RepID=A0A5B8VC75_9BACT|nr:response regulator [Panacibacter ginsenosidivorans]QEC68625.1 response regulator [Panacibacter ginsenosidivorans]